MLKLTYSSNTKNRKTSVCQVIPFLTLSFLTLSLLIALWRLFFPLSVDFLFRFIFFVYFPQLLVSLPFPLLTPLFSNSVFVLSLSLISLSFTSFLSRLVLFVLVSHSLVSLHFSLFISLSKLLSF